MAEHGGLEFYFKFITENNGLTKYRIYLDLTFCKIENIIDGSMASG